jgi:heat shock protein HslJ
VESQDLTGTSWEAIGYNNGKQAVTSVIAGTQMDIQFGKDGTVSGNSGCNTYSGSYTVNGNQIQIGPLASTMMACEDPAGLMDQEQQYLAALQTATTYQIEGNVLQLRTADGALAADFNKK